jgi:DHA1 family bicyclomycin/chloramphenicol resistance-like MFS transporter
VPPPVRRRRRSALAAVPLVVALLSMIGPFSIDAPFPAFPEMARDLDVDPAGLQLLVTAYLLAFGVMSVFHGPVSDAVGRRPVILAGCGVYALASLGCTLAAGLPALLAFRVLQGLSAGAGVIVSRTVIRDLYDGVHAQRLMSRVAMIFGIAPAVAPVVGGVLLQLGPWPVVFAFQAALGVALVVLVLTALPETHPAERRTPLRVGAVLGSLAAVFRTRAFHRLAWATTLAFGGQFLYIGGAAYFVVELLGQGELDFWKLFVPMIGCMTLGSAVSARTAGRVPMQTLVTTGLAVAASASLLNVLVAAIAGPVLPWAVLGPSLLALGVGASYPSLQLLLLDLFPSARGAVVSAATFLTLVVNAVAAATLTPLAARSVTGMAVASAAMVVGGLGLWLLHVRAPVPSSAPGRTMAA